LPVSAETEKNCTKVMTEYPDTLPETKSEFTPENGWLSCFSVGRKPKGSWDRSIVVNGLKRLEKCHTRLHSHTITTITTIITKP